MRRYTLLLLILGLSACTPTPEAARTLATADPLVSTPTKPPASAASRLYVLSNVRESTPPAARLAAYDPASGEHLFSREFQGRELQAIINPAGTMLYVLNRHQIHAISARDGVEVWQQRLVADPEMSDSFTLLAVDEQRGNLYLLQRRSVEALRFDADLITFDLATRQWSPGIPISDCATYAALETLLVCTNNDLPSGYGQTPPGHVKFINMTTGRVESTLVMSAGVGTIAFEQQAQALWIARAIPYEYTYAPLQPRPLELIVVDLNQYLTRTVTLPPPVGDTGRALPALSFDPAGSVLRVTQYQAGKAMGRLFDRQSLQELAAFQLPTQELSESHFTLDNRIWIGRSWRWDELYRVRSDGQPLSNLEFPGDDLTGILIAQAPPGIAPQPIPAPTPLPTPRLGSGQFPAPPEDWHDAPAAITAWLNESPANPPRISAMIAEWQRILWGDQRFAGWGYHTRNRPDHIRTSDLDGNGTDEIVISMLGREPSSHRHPGRSVQQLMVVYLEDGRYKVTAHTATGSRKDPTGIALSQISLTYLWEVADLTNDGWAEIITDAGHCGAHTCFGYPNIWQWSPAGLRNVLMQASYTPTHELEPDIQTTFAELTLVDEHHDGIQELQVIAGGVGSVGGCCQRRTVSTYAWDGAAYRFDRVEFVEDSSQPFWQLMDAARLFRDGNYAPAYDLYQNILDNPSQGPDAVPYPTVARAARFQLMVTALLLSRPTEAQTWHAELVAGEDRGWADSFWQAYQQTGDLRSACVSAAPHASAIEFRNTGYTSWRADRVTCVVR